MRTKRTTGLSWLGAALLAAAGLAGRAEAATSAALNIDVTISGSKSVAVNSVASSSDTTSVSWTTPNQAIPSPSTVTVTNNSGVLSEGWELSTNASALAPSGTPWTLAGSTTSVGAEQFAVQAVFGSSSTTSGQCASNASWTKGTIAPILQTTPQQYVASGLYADSGLATGGASTYQPDNGNNMYPYSATTGVGRRALCWRLILPLSTAQSATQNIQVIVTAL